MFRCSSLKKTWVFALALCGSACFTPLRAQTVGTTTADILKINDGIRPAAMGGAYTAMGDDLYCINYNPAGLSYIKASQAVFFHLDSLASIQYEYLAFGTAWGSGNVLAGNVIYRHMDPIDNQPGVLPAVNSDDLLSSLSYAMKLGDNLRLGITGKFLKSDLASFSATALAFDAGVVLDRLPLGIKAGLSIQNVGTAMTFEQNSSSDPLPIYIRLGIGTHQMIDKDKDLDFELDLLKPSTQGSGLLDQGLQLELGAEYWVFPRLFAVRAGYDLQNIGALYGGKDFFGNNAPGVPNAFNNYTLGCTLTRPLDDCDLSVDIAYAPANFTSTTEDTFSFGLYFKFNQLRIF